MTIWRTQGKQRHKKHVSYDLVPLTGTGVTSFFVLSLFFFFFTKGEIYIPGKQGKHETYLDALRKHETN